MLFSQRLQKDKHKGLEKIQSMPQNNQNSWIWVTEAHMAKLQEFLRNLRGKK